MNLGQVAIIQLSEICSSVHKKKTFQTQENIGLSSPKREKVILGWYNLAVPRFTSELGGWPNLSQPASVVRTTLTDAATLELLAQSFIGIWSENAHPHTNAEEEASLEMCHWLSLKKKRPFLRRSSSPPQWKYQHKTLKARPKTTQRLTSAERQGQKEMWHFLYCRLAEFIRCQAWVLCSYEERYHYRARFAYWSGSVPAAVQYGAQRICEFKNEKDLCTLIETFVLLQTAVIVWVSVGSCSFIHIVTLGFVGSSLRMVINSADVLIRTDQKPER